MNDRDGIILGIRKVYMYLKIIIIHLSQRSLTKNMREIFQLLVCNLVLLNIFLTFLNGEIMYRSKLYGYFNLLKCNKIV